MDIHKILKQLPHRYPFLLPVLSIDKGKTIRCCGDQGLVIGDR